MDITISLDPVILEVGGVAFLRWYSIAITTAIFVAVWLIDREFKRKGMDTTHYGGIADLDDCARNHRRAHVPCRR